MVIAQEIHGRPIAAASLAGCVRYRVIAGGCRAGSRAVHRHDQGRRQGRKGQPVDGAKVTIDMAEGTSRKFETKTNKKGEFIQIGLRAGAYKVTAEKDKLASNTADVARQHRPPGRGQPRARRRRRGRREGSRGEERRVEEGVRGRRRREPRRQPRRGDRQVHRGSRAEPDLLRLLLQHRLLGDAEEGLRQGRSGVQEGDRAEAGRRRGLQRPGQRLQRDQRKFDEAAAASAKATELAAAPARQPAAAAATPTRCSTRASSSGTRARSPRRRSSSKAAIAANPNHAEAHYQLGMALVNEGNLAGAATEFETYLKLAPTGPNAATAKGIARRAAQEVVIDRPPRSAPGWRTSARASRGAAGRVGATPPPSASSPSPRHFLRTTSAPLADAGPGRLRREQGPGSAAEDGRDVRRSPLRWHLVGHLQSNKAQKGRARFDVVHSVDTAALVAQARRSRRGCRTARSSCWCRSISPARRPSTARAKTTLPAIFDRGASVPRRARVVGLMLLPPAVDDPEAARPYFQALRGVRDACSRAASTRRCSASCRWG